MIINEKYISRIFFSQAAVDAEGWNKSFSDTDGLFRATIYVRNSETKKEEGFYGQISLSKEGDTEQRKLEQKSAIKSLRIGFEESDIYKSGKYEIRNALTHAWEQPV